MAHYQEQYGQTDEHGNPIGQRVDEYGNPIHHTSTTGGYGTAGYGTTHAPTQLAAGTYGGAPGVGTDTVREHGLSGMLHHSGSSSSSSSEDDGHGGRRKKKGLKEKVKEKLSGHRDFVPWKGRIIHLLPSCSTEKIDYDRSQATSTTTPGTGSYYSAEECSAMRRTDGYCSPCRAAQQHAMKEIMDKIKEKRPGHHHDHH